VPGPGPEPPAAGRTAGRLGGLPVLFITAFAALLAAFPARNSDLWMHLAAGRLLAHGESPSRLVLSLGVRENQTWLHDVLAYGVYSACGVTGLAVCKVLVVVGLALVLLRLSRTGRGWYLAAACTALALLAMSMRLLLQPGTLSCLLLALAFSSAVRGREAEGGPGRAARALPPGLPWPLLVLFVIWANVDGAFVLGLGVVALVWLGRALDSLGTRREAGGGPSRYGLVPAALGLLLLGAACLLNPSHLRAFTPAAELVWFGRPRPPGASVALGHGMSPFQPAYFLTFGASPAALAYFPLLGLGLLSFLVNYRRLREGKRRDGATAGDAEQAGGPSLWERFLPWLGLALLSAVQVRAVPYFAVVGGPVLAWNLQEMVARSGGRQKASRVPAAPWLLLAAGCLLLFAWPGWLQAPPFEPRRLGVEFPPALERGAATTRRWYREGLLTPGKRGLHLSPETACAFAWFCPEDDALLDDRLTSGLLAGREGEGGWEQRLRSAGVDHVVVYDPDRGRLLAALDRLLRDPARWPLLYLEGDLAVFGWRDPARGDPFRGRELDLNRLAFHPPPDQKAPREPAGPGPELRRWWEAFWKPAPPRPIERDEAALYLLFAEARARSAPARRLAAWEASHAAGLVGSAAGWAGPRGLVDFGLRRALLRPPLPERGGEPAALSRMVLALQHAYALGQDDTPPALPYLAVRSARRALAASPGDARAYLALGEGYLWLLHGTRERVWAGRVRELVQLRHAQASAALNRAAALDPDLARAHHLLAGLYQEIGYLDLALEHMRASRRWSRRRGSAQVPGGADAGPADDDPVARLAGVVAERERAYDAEAADLRVLDRARLAFDKGLAGRARDLLLESNVAAFGPQGMRLELELLLRTGQAHKVREWTLPEHRAALGAVAYHWLRAQALAASGDYAPALEECESLASEARGAGGASPREAMAVLAGKAVLDAQLVGAAVPELVWGAVAAQRFQGRAAGLAKGMCEEANANAFRGLLALEEGDTDEAGVAFRLALALWGDDAAAASGAGLDFKTRPLARGYLRWLE
jgi:tetratricopeptide (TPR) repeat protein